jgi:hypothetical protein
MRRAVQDPRPQPRRFFDDERQTGAAFTATRDPDRKGGHARSSSRDQDRRGNIGIVTFSDALDSLPREKESPTERFLQALALFEDGVALQKTKLRRKFPDASEARIEELLRAWLAREDEP